MRVLLVGGTGTIGGAVAKALGKHDVIIASRHTGEQVDVTKPDSIRALFSRVGRVDAVVSTAGQALFKPLAELTSEDFAFCIQNKLVPQVDLIRLGLNAVNDGGSITVTSGILAEAPTPGGSAISLVNAGLEGFARAAALEAPRGVRVNVVSPPWAKETRVAMGLSDDVGLPAETIARAYAQSVEGTQTGQVIRPR